jgi:hypothetical protein
MPVLDIDDDDDDVIAISATAFINFPTSGIFTRAVALCVRANQRTALRPGGSR